MGLALEERLKVRGADAAPGTRRQSSVMAGYLKGEMNHGGRGPAMKGDHT